MRKIFVLRPNSLLSSSNSTLRFGEDNTIVVPMAVVEELQRYHGKPEKVKIAKEILEYLEMFDAREITNHGVTQSNGSTLKIALNYSEEQVEMENISELDKRCLQVCLGLKKDNPSVRVILVSKNSTLRIKAKILGIEAENFRDDLFPSLPEQYSGRVEISVPSEKIDFLYEKHYLEPEDVPNSQDINWVTNMFIVGTDTNGVSKQSFLGRFDGQRIVPLQYQNYFPGVTPKNLGQKLLLECLMTSWEQAPLVIAKGGAGTGKTFCSLGVGLEKLGTEYEQILVATPSETIGQERLGFLPGDIREKVSPYLGGIRDNLKILIGNGKKKGKSETVKDGMYLKEEGDYYFEKGLIQIQPIGFLRGRTIVKTLFIIDETQNIDPSDIKSIVTRAAEGSKFVFLGDPSQVDNPKLSENYNGLVYLSEKMKGDPLCWQVTLSEKESVRSDLARIAATKL